MNRLNVGDYVKMKRSCAKFLRKILHESYRYPSTGKVDKEDASEMLAVSMATDPRYPLKGTVTGFGAENDDGTKCVRVRMFNEFGEYEHYVDEKDLIRLVKKKKVSGRTLGQKIRDAVDTALMQMGF